MSPRDTTQDTPSPLPGARTSCALLTMLTVLLAWPDPPPLLAALARMAYFAVLTWFLWRTGRASPELDRQPMRLVCGGFAVLFLGGTIGGLVHASGLETRHEGYLYLREVCERGALSLLGTTLVAYGLMLWLPRVLQGHRLLAEHAAAQQGALRHAATERSELERRLVDADRRGMLGELAATIAHDLRNPLTIVKGTAESLCRRPRSQQEIAEHTDVIRRNVEKADRTMTALIDLARPPAHTAIDVPALELLREAEALLRVEARRRGVSLRLAAAPQDVFVHGDRALLVHALINLLLNAVQASAAGTTIALEVRTFAAGVVLAVADRGSGLPPHVRPHLFTPFFTTKPTGTGLGLSSCRRIVRELGGELRLYPRTRGGTRALLLLPHRGAGRDRAPAATGALACTSSGS